MKKVLIDFRFLRHLNCGFGYFCLYFGNYLKDNPLRFSDLNITLLTPKEYVGYFGDQVKYIETRPIYKIFPFLMPKYDIWHSTTQSQRYFCTNESSSRIITVHDLNVIYEKSTEKSKKRLRRLQENINISDYITTVSKFSKSEILKHLNLREIPIEVNYVGLRDLTMDKAEKPQFVDDTTNMLFSIGDFAEKKNFHLLLDLMKLMPEYKLYICGRNTSEYGNMMKRRIENEAISNVFLPGMISAEEKIWMYKNCKAFLFPSKFEGFGIPVIDGMMFGKPVFCSRLTSLNEIGDKYAFFWENFDPQYMKNIIEQNINHFEKDAEYIERQIAYAKGYNIERSIETFLRIYRELPPKKKSFVKSTKNLFSFWIYKII